MDLANSRDIPDRFWLSHKGAYAAGLVVVLAAMVWVVGAHHNGTHSTTGAPPIPVAIVRADQRDVPHVVEAVGTVQSLEAVSIRPQVDGVLTALLFHEGDHAARGQLLATIDDRALSAALAAVPAQLARDQVELRLARLDLDRYSGLLRRNAIARQTVDQQRAQVDQLGATVAIDLILAAASAGIL